MFDKSELAIQAVRGYRQCVVFSWGNLMIKQNRQALRRRQEQAIAVDQPQEKQQRSARYPPYSRRLYQRPLGDINGMFAACLYKSASRSPSTWPRKLRAA